MFIFKYLELKAEIEKLKAAQRSHRNIDPEQYRLCRQEITSLRMKLHQRERDMAEMQRWGALQSPSVSPGALGMGDGGGEGPEGPGRTLPPSHLDGAAHPPRLPCLILSFCLSVGRAWKEKFEQAEKRKLQEIKELQVSSQLF